MAEVAAVVGTIASIASAGVQLLRAQQEAAAARTQAALMRVQSQQMQLAARAEELRGQHAALDARERLLRTLAAQNARYLAAGVALGEGTPETVAEESTAAAERELELIRTETTLRAESARVGAANVMGAANAQAASGRTSLLMGVAAAGATVAEGGARAWDRWSGRAVPPPAPTMR